MFSMGISFFLIFFSFLSVVLLSKGNVTVNRKNDLYLFLFCVIPVFLLCFYYVGYRPFSAGFDTPLYVKTYLSLRDIWSARLMGIQYYGNTEVLWWPFHSLFINFLDARGWLIFNYLLIFSLIWISYYFLCKNLGITPFIFVFVFFTYYMVYSGNTIRQAMALPLGLIAFVFFCKRNIFFSFVFSMISIGFHWSSIFFLLTPLMLFSPLSKRSIIIALPIFSLFCSIYMSDIFRVVLDVFPIPDLEVKYNLYFTGVRDSHVGPVWLTMNFWICTIVASIFLWVCKPINYYYKCFNFYVLLFLSLIFFGINIPDFSERFFPAILLVLPIMIALLVNTLKLPNILLNTIFLFFFFCMGLLVFINESSQQTLGYTVGLY